MDLYCNLSWGCFSSVILMPQFKHTNLDMVNVGQEKFYCRQDCSVQI